MSDNDNKKKSHRIGQVEYRTHTATVSPTARMNIDRNLPEIIELKKDVSKRFGDQLRTVNDYERLAEILRSEQGAPVSVSTLKRLWGYVKGYDSVRRQTLDILSRYVGYADWTYYVRHINRKYARQSKFLVDGFKSEELQIGEIINIAWQPNRTCSLLYLGNSRFKVLRATNTKLHPDDHFRCSLFVKDEPLYMYDLVQGLNPPTMYVAGMRGGLSVIERIAPPPLRVRMKVQALGM